MNNTPRTDATAALRTAYACTRDVAQACALRYGVAVTRDAFNEACRRAYDPRTPADWMGAADRLTDSAVGICGDEYDDATAVKRLQALFGLPAEAE